MPIAPESTETVLGLGVTPVRNVCGLPPPRLTEPPVATVAVLAVAAVWVMLETASAVDLLRITSVSTV
jgi:hypothetical protein